MLAGWGSFKLIEGIIDHHLLGIHHVRSGPNQLLFDPSFLIFGAVLPWNRPSHSVLTSSPSTVVAG
jgi:uncharacterized membrane protein